MTRARDLADRVIVDNTIVNADINTSAAIAQSKISNLTSDLASKLDLAGGKILQIVRDTDSTQRTTTSTSFVDLTGLSVTITPQKSDSAILLICIVQTLEQNTAETFELKITDSSNNDVSGAERALSGGSGSSDHFAVTTIFGYATPATTSAVTYKARFRSNQGFTVTARNDLLTAQIYAIEVSA